MIIPNFELFDKSIQDLEVCLDIFKYFKNNGADKNMQLWSEQIRERIGIVNQDDFYNYQFLSPVSMPDQSSKKALELFTDDDVAFQELLHSSLLMQGKIKSDNIKYLKSLFDLKSQKNISSIGPNNNYSEIKMVIGLLDEVFYKKDLKKWTNKFDVFKNEWFNLNDVKSLWQFLLNKIEVKRRVLAKALFAYLLEYLDNLKLYNLKIKNYDKITEIKSLIAMTIKAKVHFYHNNNIDYFDTTPSIDIDVFLHLVKLDCVKAANLISEMAKAKAGLPLLAEIKKYFKGFDCFHLFKQQGNTDHVRRFVFELSALYKDDNDCKYGYKTMYHLYGGRLNAAIKSFNKIESESTKIALLKNGFDIILELGNREFLLHYINSWSGNVLLLMRYIKEILQNKKEFNINLLYQALDKKQFFTHVLRFFLEKGDWSSIRNLNIEYPEDTAKIYAIFDEQYPIYLSKHLETVLLSGDSHLIIAFFKEHRNADVFDKTLLKVLKDNANQFEATDQVLDDSVLDCFLYAYPTNFELVKLLLFEKIKKEIILDKKSMLLNKARRNMEIEILLEVYKK